MVGVEDGACTWKTRSAGRREECYRCRGSYLFIHGQKNGRSIGYLMPNHRLLNAEASAISCVIHEHVLPPDYSLITI